MAASPVAVIGAGAIGGVAAAALVDAGHPVTLCVRTPVDGLRLTDPAGRSRDVAVEVATDPATVGPLDAVIFATKNHETESAAPWLAALCRPGTTVVVAQNGLDRAEVVRALAPTATVAGAVVYIGAERTSPGRVTHYGSETLIVADGATGALIEGLFAGSFMNVKRTSDLASAAWRKLLGNVVANPLTALTLRRSEVFAEPSVATLAEGLLAEAAAVARADGADITDEDTARLLDAVRGQRGDAGSSMLYDRLGGRPMEWDTITGEVVRRAARHGLAVPRHETILALLRAVDGRPLPSG